MMKRLRLLFQVLCVVLLSVSCGDHDDDFDGDGSLGQWYVTGIQGDYRMNVSDIETESYINNFFYSYNLKFFMGEGLDFLKDNQLIVWQLDDRLVRYDYSWDANWLTVSKGRFEPAFYVAEGNGREMRITFDRNSLVRYLNEEIYNTVNQADRDYLSAMIYKIESQVKTFYVDYMLRRRMPAVQSIISGNFYGKLIDLSDNTIIYSDAALALVQDREYVGLFLLDNIRIGNGGAFRVETPSLEIKEGQIMGNYNFAGTNRVLVENTGVVDIKVTGVCQAGNIVDMLVTLATRDGVYTLEYQTGYRNVLLPYDGYKATKAKRTINLAVKGN